VAHPSHVLIATGDPKLQLGAAVDRIGDRLLLLGEVNLELEAPEGVAAMESMVDVDLLALDAGRAGLRGRR
jgi:hypothetical protein